MPIFTKKRNVKKLDESRTQKRSILDKFRGEWVALREDKKVVAHGQTVDAIIHHVRAEDKTIEDELPDPTEVPVAMKLPKKI